MEKYQKIGVTAFILNDNHQVLLIRRSDKEKFLPNYYEMPGGKLEFGESMEEALKREIREEVNLEIELLKIYSSFSYISKNGSRHTIDIQCYAKLTDNNEGLKLSDAHDDYVWVSENDVSNFLISDLMKESIIKGFDNINK